MATMTSSAPETTATTKPAQLNPINNSSVQGIVPLSPDAVQAQPQKTVTDTTQGGTEVLKAAQETALNQKTSPLNGLVQQRTAQYLQDPNLGYNYNAYNQNQMDQYNADQSKSMEAARQQLGNTSQSGELQNEFLKNALTVSQGRANMQSKLAQDQQKSEHENLLSALAQGREGMTAEEQATKSTIENLSTARSMGEGEREQTSGQTFTTSERLSTQDFENAMEEKKMAHDEKMATVNAAIAEAKAGNDFTREKELTGLKAKLELENLYASGEIDKAKITLQGNIQSALKTQDYTQASALQQAGFTFDAQEHAKDRALKKYEDDLEQEGVNIALLREAVSSGLIGPETYFSALKDIGGKLGVAVVPPDTNAVAKEAVKDFNTAKIQWGASHPELLADPADPLKGLSPDGETQFNDFYNSALYGDVDFGDTQYKPETWNNASATTNGKAFATKPPAVGKYIKMADGQTYKVTSEVTTDDTPAGGGRQQFTAIDANGKAITISAAAGKPGVGANPKTANLGGLFNPTTGLWNTGLQTGKDVVDSYNPEQSVWDNFVNAMTAGGVGALTNNPLSQAFRFFK